MEVFSDHAIVFAGFWERGRLQKPPPQADKSATANQNQETASAKQNDKQSPVASFSPAPSAAGAVLLRFPPGLPKAAPHNGDILPVALGIPLEAQTRIHTRGTGSSKGT